MSICLLFSQTVGRNGVHAVCARTLPTAAIHARKMKQRSLTEFFGAHAGAGVGAGAGAGAGGHQGADNAAATLTALYTPKVTGRNHYAIRKKDYNPTGAEAQAFFNITELAGTFLTKGRRVLLDKFTRMAAHTIVAGTRQQKQRQAMARKYRGVAIFHGAELPPLQQLVAFCRPDKKLASYFSIMGQLSYFCHEKLGRSVTYGDLGYMVHPLSPTERRACSASEHDTVFSVFMEWCQQARDAAAYSPTVIDKYRRTEVKSRSGRDGSEDVVVVAAEYSASTAFNRAKAWQLVVAAYANG